MSQYEAMIMQIVLNDPDPAQAELERLEVVHGPFTEPMTNEEATVWGDSQGRRGS